MNSRGTHASLGGKDKLLILPYAFKWLSVLTLNFMSLKSKGKGGNGLSWKGQEKSIVHNICGYRSCFVHTESLRYKIVDLLWCLYQQRYCHLGDINVIALVQKDSFTISCPKWAQVVMYMPTCSARYMGMHISINALQCGRELCWTHLWICMPSNCSVPTVPVIAGFPGSGRLCILTMSKQSQ